ncbi:MAG: hypothetical protein LBS55_10355 [Prevotellaceae bacterium]|jgi:hypothetical protein|nr:hypothetical protein [Prevotellaceae bacterium]
MTDQRIIDIVRNENYPLKIYNASNNNNNSITVSTELIKAITAIYKYIEPSHLNGKLIIYKRLTENELLQRKTECLVYNKDVLTHTNTPTTVIESYGEQLYLWNNIDDISFLGDTDTVFYCYESNTEYFYVNKQKIEIPHLFECSSIYALHYFYLNSVLLQYKSEKILTSNCLTFNDCWNDENRIFFKPAPEEKMQISLKEFLSSALRGVEVIREYNLGASKPVDIRVKWTEANKSALIELKWLGKSKSDRNLTTYTDSRADDGVLQLKQYIDMDNTDTPNIISKAYLVVIDGRRRNTNENTTIINSENGLYYENREINFSDEHKYFDRLKNFVKPIRMFAKPIIS